MGGGTSTQGDGKRRRFTKSSKQGNSSQRTHQMPCTENGRTGKEYDLVARFILFFNAICVPQLNLKILSRENGKYRNRGEVERFWEEKTKNFGDKRFSQIKKILSSREGYLAWQCLRYLKQLALMRINWKEFGKFYIRLQKKVLK